jgi:spore coat protein H
MRNRVAFDVWNAFSKLPYKTSFGSRNGTVGKFVEVYVNNEYKGIYCLTDRINRKLLKLKKIHQDTDTTYTVRGVLYKQGTTDVADQSTLGYFQNYSVCVIRWHNAWELTEPEDYACKQAWIPLQTVYDNQSTYAFVKANYFIDNIADYTLFLMAMSIQDNWGNKNKYLSARNIQSVGDTARFVFTPWDLDASLGGSYNGSYYGGTYTNWTINDIIKTAVAPFSTCLNQQEFKKLLAEKWKTARDQSLSVDSVAQRLRNYRDLFINSGAWARQSTYFDAQKYKPCYVNDLSAEIEYIISWYKNRVNAMDAYFGTTDDISTIHKDIHPVSYHPGVFDLSGRKITHINTNNLPAHIYIVNGKKVIK